MKDRSPLHGDGELHCSRAHMCGDIGNSGGRMLSIDANVKVVVEKSFGLSE